MNGLALFLTMRKPNAESSENKPITNSENCPTDQQIGTRQVGLSISPAETVRLVNERDELRRSNPNAPRVREYTVEVSLLSIGGQTIGNIVTSVQDLVNCGQRLSRPRTLEKQMIRSWSHLTAYEQQIRRGHPESDIPKRRILRCIQSLPTEEAPTPSIANSPTCRQSS